MLNAKTNAVISTLRNLHPLTVMNVTDVDFITRALAMPKVLDASKSIQEVEPPTGSDQPTALDVTTQLSIQPETSHRMVVMENHVVAGGLVYDRDSSHLDPFLDDANGHLYHYSSRHGSDDERSDFYRALGLDRNGEQDLNDECVSDRLVAHVTESIRKDRSIMTTLSLLLRSQGKSSTWAAVFKQIRDSILHEGWEFALDYIATAFFGVRWWREISNEFQEKLEPLADLLSENQAIAAWESAVTAGDIGEPLAQLLDIHEHGSILYKMAGGAGCPWDTTRNGAVWVPDDLTIDNIRTSVLHRLALGAKSLVACPPSGPQKARFSLDGGLTWTDNLTGWPQAINALLAASGRAAIEPAELNRMLCAEAENYCRAILDEYNAWRNSEVYGVVVYVIDRHTGIQTGCDEFWGCVGYDHATARLDETIMEMVMRLASPLH